jgi:hypothetical protein
VSLVRFGSVLADLGGRSEKIHYFTNRFVGATVTADEEGSWKKSTKTGHAGRTHDAISRRWVGLLHIG